MTARQRVALIMISLAVIVIVAVMSVKAIHDSKDAAYHRGLAAAPTVTMTTTAQPTQTPTVTTTATATRTVTKVKIKRVLVTAASRSRSSSAAPNYASGNTVWDRLAMCESSGNWAINTGNGFYGGLQFTLSTWHAYGGTGYPHQASRETQIAVAQRVLAGQGWGAWPACSSKLGLR